MKRSKSKSCIKARILLFYGNDRGKSGLQGPRIHPECFRGAAVLNFQTMKNNLLAELENPLDHRRTTNVVTPYYFQRDLEQKRIKVVPRIQQYGLLVFDKRFIHTDTKSSYPYGYERIGGEVELLLDL